MATAKFKIGQLAKINDDAEGTFIFGRITGIVTQEKGYSYQLEDAKLTVSEDQILEVYVPLKTSKRSTGKKSTRARKSANVTLESRGDITQ